MEGIEVTKTVGVKQEPTGDTDDRNAICSISLESLTTVTIKQEPLESNECTIDNSTFESANSIDTKEESSEYDIRHSTVSKPFKIVSLTEEIEEKSISIKKELPDENNKNNMCYSISVENIKSECEEEYLKDLHNNMRANRNQLETSKSEIIKQNTKDDPHINNVSDPIQLNAKQHLNTLTRTKTNECKSYDVQKERLQQCIARITALEEDINTHCVQNPPINNKCDKKSANENKKRIRPPGEKRYECDMCDFKASRPSQLESHRRTHTGEKPHQCKDCDFKSARMSTLKQHISRHTGEKRYKCDTCDFRTAHGIDLKRHIKTHTGEKPHKCEECDYSTIRLTSLKRHMRTHTGEKPYECDMCDYKSPNDNGLRQHKRTHTGEKPYKCNVCDYKSAQSSALKKHMNKHLKQKQTITTK